MTEREEFWALWNEISSKIPVGDKRDAQAANAGAWEMFKLIKSKQQKSTTHEPHSPH